MAAASDVTYGTWKHTDSPYQIRYALPAFREIEFYIGEGFRRIPYGGIEHGGLLFGKRDDDSIQIEAFRPIECEHASGPSFSLSEKDLAGVRQQLASYTEQPELADLVPVGMFISHSRRDLPVTDDELSLLRELFNESWQCLLVVKPEKFKPAQFVFVLRATLNAGDANVAEAVFVLPSPPRAERKSHREPQPAPQTAVVEQAPEPKPKAARTRPRRTAAKLKPLAEVKAEVEESESSVRRVLPARTPPAQALAGPEPKRRPRTRIVTFAILLSFVAIAVCFLWFYWNYLEPPIEIHATSQPRDIVLTWPAQTTATAARAQLRIWAGGQNRVVALSLDERKTGSTTIPVSSSDITIELLASYWLHERRGLVRVIRAP